MARSVALIPNVFAARMFISIRTVCDPYTPVTFFTSSKNCFLLSLLIPQFTGGL